MKDWLTHARAAAVLIVTLVGGVFVSSTSWSLPWVAEAGIRQCLSTFTSSGSWYDKDSFDYCDVDDAFFRGDDVGLRYGRQLNVIDVVRQLRHYYKHNAATEHEGRFARDLNSCIRNYRAVASGYFRDSDRCRVKVGRLTAGHWGLTGGGRASVELWRALNATLSISLEFSAPNDARRDGYVERRRRHGERHHGHARRHGQQVNPTYSCCVAFGGHDGSA